MYTTVQYLVLRYNRGLHLTIFVCVSLCGWLVEHSYGDDDAQLQGFGMCMTLDII